MISEDTTRNQTSQHSLKRQISTNELRSSMRQDSNKRFDKTPDETLTRKGLDSEEIFDKSFQEEIRKKKVHHSLNYDYSHWIPIIRRKKMN